MENTHYIPFRNLNPKWEESFLARRTHEVYDQGITVRTLRALSHRQGRTLRVPGAAFRYLPSTFALV